MDAGIIKPKMKGQKQHKGEDESMHRTEPQEQESSSPIIKTEKKLSEKQ